VRQSARRSASWARPLLLIAAFGGLLALLGTWLALDSPRCPPLATCSTGGGEWIMLIGLGMATLSGLVAIGRVVLKVIVKLDGDRQPARADEPKRPE